MAALYSIRYDEDSFQHIKYMLGEIEYKAIMAILDEIIAPEINKQLFPVMSRELYIHLMLRTFSKLFDPIPNQIVLIRSETLYSETSFHNVSYIYINYDIEVAKNYFLENYGGSASLGKTIIYDCELNYWLVNSLQQFVTWRNEQLSLPPFLRFK